MDIQTIAIEKCECTVINSSTETKTTPASNEFHFKL